MSYPSNIKKNLSNNNNSYFKYMFAIMTILQFLHTVGIYTYKIFPQDDPSVTLWELCQTSRYLAIRSYS